MADHQELVEELARVNSMSTEDRLNHAQYRRTEQLQRWNEYEQEQNKSNNSDAHQSQMSNKVKFGDCITLLEAAARSDFDELEELLKQNIDPNKANEDGLTALHQACIDNLDDIVELLLDYNADVNAVDSEFWTPLHAACTCGHTNIAEILVQRGANLLALNADHNMPYDICEEDDTLEYIEQAMAKQGITQDDINEARSSKERLIIKDLKEYLDNGGDINVTDDVDATILHVAAANGYLDLTRLFLLHTNNINAQDKDGWTPLHAAACWCQMEVIEMLGVEHNADPTIKNKFGELPSDVTEDEEIKAMLHKMVKAQKDSRKKKLFSGLKLNGKNSSSRKSGRRGQSFKGRSKRDKKNGISAVEAKSESEFWHKGQETDMRKPNDSTSVRPLDGSKVGNNSKTESNHDVTTGNNSTKLKMFSQPKHQNGDVIKSFSSKKSGLFKLKRDPESKAKHGETLLSLKQRRSNNNESGSPQLATTEQENDTGDSRRFTQSLRGSGKKEKGVCVIL